MVASVPIRPPGVRSRAAVAKGGAMAARRYLDVAEQAVRIAAAVLRMILEARGLAR